MEDEGHDHELKVGVEHYKVPKRWVVWSSAVPTNSQSSSQPATEIGLRSAGLKSHRVLHLSQNEPSPNGSSKLSTLIQSLPMMLNASSGDLLEGHNLPVSGTSDSGRRFWEIWTI